MRRMFKQFFGQPVFPDDDTGKSYSINIILWMSFGAFLISAVLVPFMFPHPAQYVLIMAGEAALLLIMLNLLRRGAVRQASIGLLSGLWVILLISTFYSGGTRAGPAYLIGQVILGAGLLLGARASYAFAGVSTIAALGLALYETRYGLPPPVSGNSPLGAWLTVILNYWWGVMILYLATRTIEYALNKSQKMSQALAEANASLKESEQNFRQLMEEAADGIFIPDPQGRLLEVNRRGCEMLGYTRDELLQLSITDLMPLNMRKNFNIHLDQMDDGKSALIERSLLRKDGTLIPVEINAKKMENGRLQAIIRDISQRKRVEAELQASLIRFRNFVDHATDSFFLHDANGLLIDVNRQAYESLGYTREELLAIKPYELDPLVDQQAFEKIGERLAKQSIFTFESLHRRKDGTLIPVEINLRRYQENGQTFGISLARDITERKKAEAERQSYLHFLESLDRISQVFQSTNDLEAMMKQALEIILDTFQCDRAWLLTPCDPETTSWSIPIEVTRPPYEQVYLPELALPLEPDLADLFRLSKKTGKPIVSSSDDEAPLPAMMRNDFKAQAQLVMVLDPQIAPPYLLGIQQCSPRIWLSQEGLLFQEMGRRLETALNSSMIFHNLRENEKKLEQAQRMAKLGYWEIDLITGLVNQSQELWSIFGLEPYPASLDILTWTEAWQRHIKPDDFVKSVEKMVSSLGKDQSFEFEMALIPPDGEPRFAVSRGYTTLDSQGNPLRVFGMTQDITKIKQTEQALQERETLYRTLFEQASDGVVLHDAISGEAVAANQALATMLDCGISDIIGTGMTEGVAPEDVEDSLSRWRQILREGHLAPYERRVITHTGRTRYFEINASAIYKPAGEPHYIQAVLRDITARKQAEEQLQAALQEKEILLKEIHHRVKNNLQVISSLLYLQSLKITDPFMIELFRESRNRVAAMSLVHEQLYQSENFSRVDFATYIRTLVTSLFESYGVSETDIHLDIQTDGTTLDVHTAIPCGLLVSEMVSNSLKYAFPEGTGQIAISLNSNDLARHLMVRDSGIGMPQDSQMRPGAMGLQLIERLTLQIGGVLERSGPPGTTYHIQIPL